MYQNKNNFTNKAVKESRCFAVSIISEKTNPDLIKKFGFYSSKDTDKFSDFEYELQMAQTNRVVNPKVDTMFLVTSEEYSYLSSTILKEIARYGGKLDRFAPPCIIEKVRSKYASKGE